MGKFFDKFPLIEYDGKLARNLLVNVDFTEQTKKDIYSNFDYVISDNLYRPDMLSNINYNSPYYDWLIYLSNNVIDPYFDFYMNELDLEKFIIKKYGSISAAQSKILFYRNNWAPDDGEISISIFDNLAANIQKYYKPKINNFNQVISYVRKQEDWIRSTNRIVSVPVEDVTLYQTGDTYTENTSRGFISSIDTDNSALILYHVVGSFTNETILSKNIPDEEISFWAPVTAYDYETEANEVKKHINLIKNSYLPDLEKKFIEQLE